MKHTFRRRGIDFRCLASAQVGSARISNDLHKFKLVERNQPANGGQHPFNLERFIEKLIGASGIASLLSFKTYVGGHYEYARVWDVALDELQQL